MQVGLQAHYWGFWIPTLVNTLATVSLLNILYWGVLSAETIQSDLRCSKSSICMRNRLYQWARSTLISNPGSKDRHQYRKGKIHARCWQSWRLSPGENYTLHRWMLKGTSVSLCVSSQRCYWNPRGGIEWEVTSLHRSSESLGAELCMGCPF